MAGISSLGIGSGVLTGELVDQLVAVEQEPTENRLNAEEEILTARISEFGALKELVSGFESSVSSLNLSSSFQNNTSSSSNENAVTGTASSVASPGLYSIEVDALAQSQTLASLEFSSLDDIVGEGTLTFSFGSVATTVDGDSNVTSFDGFTADTTEAVKSLKIDATNHTVSGMRDAINSADLGVKATIVDTGSGYRLLIQSESTGENNGFTVGVSNATNGLDNFEFNATNVGAGLLHTTNASDAQFSVNGLNITREDNVAAGVINGVTLNLKQATSGPVTLSVERDTAAVTEKVSGFIESYNELKTRINELTAYDSTEEAGSLFTGDSTIRSLQTQMQRVLGSVITSLVGSEFRALSEVGISTNKDSGMLQFNSSTFSNLLSSNADEMTALFTKTGSATDANIEFLSGSNKTVASDYDVVITQVATRGSYEGNSTSGSFIINSLNDTFKINVNGTNSGTVQLNQGIYTGDEMAAHLQAQINSDSELLGDGRGVDVSYDSDSQAFTVTSSSYGSLSSVNFTSLDTATADTLGFATPGQGPRLLGSSSNLASGDTLAAGVTIDASNENFSLTVAGVTSGNLQLANGTYTDGSDLASAVQAAINSDTNFNSEGILASVTFSGEQGEGQLLISFNNDEPFAIDSADAGLNALLGINTGSQEASAVASLAVTDDFASAVTIDGSNDEFSLTVNGTASNSIQIANGSYTDAASLAAAIEAAIQADTNLQGAELVAQSGATTTAGSLDIGSAGLDFSSANRSLQLNYNGVDLEVLVNQDATTDLNADTNAGDSDDNLFAIQSALDSALTAAGFAAGDIAASVSGSGLVLTTAATGASETLQVVADGYGAETGTGSTILAGGENYAALAGATFTLDVAGTSVDVDLAATVDGSGVSSVDVLAQIQSALDAGLTTAGLNAGDIEARLDGSNQVYLYDTQNQSSASSLSITAVGADDALGLTALVGTAYSGRDGFGLAEGTVAGVDQQTLAETATVEFEGGNAEGGFKVSFGNGATFVIDSAEAAMADDLGISDQPVSQSNIVRGVDVAGTINGVAATGTGQLLVGAVGDDTEGLRINVTGGPIGNRGSVSFVRGIADQLDRLLDNVLSGALSTKQDGFQRELDAIGEERTALNERVEAFRARLEKQFLYNDILVQQLNSTQDYLKTQFEVLNAVFTGKN